MATPTDAGAAALAALAERAPATSAALAAAPEPLRASAPQVLAASDFVLDALVRDPLLLPMLGADADGRCGCGPLPFVPPADEAGFSAALRRWRRGELARIAWRELAGWVGVPQTLADLSRAADLGISAAYAFARALLERRYGTPRSATGAPQPLVIVGMGKLGGRELNFSSDVDLVFLFPEGGDTDGERPLANEEFFTRLGQLLIRLLDAPTDEGFGWRVDMRLRPFGDSGPLVASFAAFEDYLQIHGRDWERYAWIKARAISGAEAYAELFRNVVRPFVYRRYLDFGVFDSLREMKGMIEREVARRDLADNIKLGAGGIREIEFIVQAFQLVRGGQDQRLQSTSLLQVLPLLAGGKLLPVPVVSALQASYLALRRLENALQMRADRQTHLLPGEAGERARVAQAMGAPDWDTLAAQIGAQRAQVAAHFRDIVFAGDNARGAATSAAAPPGWEPGLAPGQLAARLATLGYDDPAAAAQLLDGFTESSAVRRLDATGRRRLEALLPVLVTEAGAGGEGASVLRRLLNLLESIRARSAYFSLLVQHTRARHRLVGLARHGDFLTAQIAAHPLLLDELLDESLLEHPPDRRTLAADLEQRMAGLAAEPDEERVVEQLRHFQRAALFRIAVADLSGRLPVMQVSDRLTDVAELILESAMASTWRQLTPTLGVPMCGAGAARRPVRICAVGYGKLGGMELGYSSDLDLVFLHDSLGERQETEGARTLDNQVYFVRFAQRLVHLLSMHSAAGRLYEVDMRLRPSGKGGLPITGMEAFADYQRTAAWTWEHQALLHARGVAGDAALLRRFEALRVELLREHVRRDTLRAEVRSMRGRMRRELVKGSAGEFDLKQAAGGIADIEFLAQYWALAWAHDYPQVAMFADTIRQLESVASADLVPQAEIDLLTAAYRAYRTRLHHLTLDQGRALVPASEFSAERAAVTRIWNQTFGADE
ncbi:MAG: bifunctional [glutamate--ammonia ligase]-adenylyl-L-tyrosine phosphorylase/[glutamate--ammonia-ligase] adenylyltransferase [Gammaproteobacteria bacterium]|nr:bifunctional [glutamate--ammonia ligase]-adenylyl-L-tyrosine phosphorylase/[glutamate--ammonia-ligase] adenylyltransferase [Gammaproteobacteria bacterium]